MIDSGWILGFCYVKDDGLGLCIFKTTNGSWEIFDGHFLKRLRDDVPGRGT